MEGISSWSSPPKYNTDDLITCYIYNMLNNQKIQFKTLPEDINESYSAEWQQTDIMGRSAPYIAYISNPARSVDYSVVLNRDILGDEGYKNTIDGLKKLVYPNYVGNSIVAAPYCYVRFGYIVKMFAVVESVSLSWSGTIIGDENSNANEAMYSQCECSLSFIELRTEGQGLPTANSLGYMVKDF